MEYVIYRDGLNIYRDSGNEIDGRGASNVPFNVIYNGSGTDEYSDYEIQLHYGYKENNKEIEKFVLANSDGLFLIPQEAFKNGGNLRISLKFAKTNVGSRTSVNVLNYNVKNNPDGSQSFAETQGDTLNELVKGYLDKLVQDGQLTIQPRVRPNGNIYFSAGNS